MPVVQIYSPFRKPIFIIHPRKIFFELRITFKCMRCFLPAPLLYLKNRKGQKIWERGGLSHEPHTLCYTRVSGTEWSESAASP